jgi:hypothetical protein
MRWKGHAARTREMKSAYKVLVGKKTETFRGDLEVDGRILMKRISKK